MGENKGIFTKIKGAFKATKFCAKALFSAALGTVGGAICLVSLFTLNCYLLDAGYGFLELVMKPWKRDRARNTRRNDARQANIENAVDIRLANNRKQGKIQSRQPVNKRLQDAQQISAIRKQARNAASSQLIHNALR